MISLRELERDKPVYYNSNTEKKCPNCGCFMFAVSNNGSFSYICSHCGKTVERNGVNPKFKSKEKRVVDEYWDEPR